MKHKLLFVLLLFNTFVCFGQNSFTVDAPKVVSLDETFRIVFTADAKISNFNWPGSNDFTIAWGPQTGSMHNTQIINGKRTSTFQETYTYLLQPKAEGKFTLPAATATIDKKEYTCRSLTIEVVKGSSASPQSNNPNSDEPQSTVSTNISKEDVFLKLSLNKTNVVKGEPIIATLKLYSKVDISGFENIKFPTFNGFWSKETESPQNIEFERENVGGEIYSVALLRKYMLIPQQTGTITIDPSEMICQLRLRTPETSAPKSVFDDFFDSYQTVRKRITSSAVKVNVNHLPANAPASFAGGAGDFKMSTRFSKEGILSHDAASLIVTITGRGNISLLEAPKITFPPDFEVYDIKTTENISADGTNGTKTFEFPFIPRSYGEFKIDPIEYSFYDISKGKYITLNSGILNLKVGKGEEVAQGGVALSGINKQSVKNLSDDIRFISTGSANLRKIGSFFVGSILFFVILGIIVIFYFVAVRILNIRALRRKDIAGSKNRKANMIARTRLKIAGSYLKQNLNSAYYDELHKAVLGYISDKLTIPVADLSKDKIREVLSEKETSAELIESLISLIDSCEYARYAPDAGHEAMENHYNEAVRVISELEGKVKNVNKKVGNSSTAIVLLLALVISSTVGVTSVWAADDVKTLWKEANQSYTEGKYDDALTKYHAIESENMVSAQLYYNIANTYYKLGDNAHSILYFEKSLKQDPSYKDAQNNIAILQEQTLDKIDVVPDFILVTWVKKAKYIFSSDAWAWVTISLLFIVAILMLIFKYGPSSGKRKISFIFACSLMVFAIFSISFSITERKDSISQDKAILMLPVTSVKSSPDDAGKSLFILHEGTKVNMLDSLGEWIKIELSDGRQGWIMSSAVEFI
ncbi:MAG: BatD family protein [Bacteroidales bacterium]|nr:BatD family protein [Bacteroidales bacterium]